MRQDGFVYINGVERLDGGEVSGSITFPSKINDIGVATINSDVLLGNQAVTEVIVGEGIKLIRDSAFHGCSNLVTATLPSTLETIGPQAFADCTSLTQITLPESLTCKNEMDSMMMFSGCTSLTSIRIPPLLTNIPRGAFENCTNLTEVILEEGLVSIGGFAFENCSKLKGLTIPSTVKSIGDVIFGYTERESLPWLHFLGDAPEWGFNSLMNVGKIFIERGTAGWPAKIPGHLQWHDGRYMSSNIENTLTPIEYWSPVSVTFNAAGGVLEGDAKRTFIKGEAIGSLPTASRLGYTFKGWFSAKSKGAQVKTTTKITKTMTVYAQWSPKKFKVRLNGKPEGGSATGTGTYAVGSKVTIKATPAKNRLFWGWENSIDCEGMSDEEADAVQASLPRGLNCMDTKNLTLTFKMPPCDVWIDPFFIKKSEDSKPEIKVVGETPWYVENGGELVIDVHSGTYAKLNANNTIPAGMSLTADSKDERRWHLKVTNRAKLPAGVKTIKFTAKNRSGQTGSRNIQVILPNKSQAIEQEALALDNDSTKVNYSIKAGIKDQWQSLDIYALNGWTISAVTGIPGLKWNAKTQKMSGVPSKAGLYTAAFTVEKGKKKLSATATVYVEPLPAGVVGTFYGYTFTPEVGEIGKASRKVTVTAGSDGKITASIGSTKMTMTGWTIEGDAYKASYSKLTTKNNAATYKYNGKTVSVASVATIDFEMSVNPSTAWNEDALSGRFDTYKGWILPNSVASLPAKLKFSLNSDTSVRARKNNAKASDEAQSLIAELAKTKAFSFKTVNPLDNWWYEEAEGEIPKWLLEGKMPGSFGSYPLNVKVDANGKATLSGKIGSTKVSGTAYLEFGPAKMKDIMEYEKAAFARFFVGNFIIEVEFQYSSPYISYSEEDKYGVGDAYPTGRIWKK